MSTTKVNDASLAELKAIEHRWQRYWHVQHTFSTEAPDTPQASRGKFYVTFPYPYMNGRIHIGHLFSASRSEFAVGFHMMIGDYALFPFGFHVTGMPISGAAKKLAAEIELYGIPPRVPADDGPDKPEKETVSTQPNIDKTDTVGQFRARKSKVKSKASQKLQWEILAELGVPKSEIPKFVDPYYWVHYFPRLCMADMQRFGARVDWRRSMITTDANPYYDAFVQWQFRRLYKEGYIAFGKRNCIWSPADGQACMDHDRVVGEGVQPQEYVAVKLEVLNPREQEVTNSRNKDLLGSLWEYQVPDGMPVYLLAATLRPETAVGQTNCWVHPEGEYGAYYMVTRDATGSIEKDGGWVAICSARSAENMAYQGYSERFGVPDKIMTVSGQDLLLMLVRAPLSEYSTVYVLPLETISMEKGTGIVMSVPSDSPDDYACYSDILLNNDGIATKYGIDAEVMLKPFEPLPIIEIAGEGTMYAARLCREAGVRSQHDRKLLMEIKEKCYTKGFYDGKMLLGPYAGEMIKACKPLCRQHLCDRGEAIIYAEPEAEVISRSNCKCVVAAADQWYLKYGEPAWRARVEKNINEYLRTYHDEVKHQFLRVTETLHEWAASRTFGLGTKLPFDPQFIIESLSDSTIYNAYYTIAQFLQGDTLDGSRGVFPVDIINDDFFDYVFCLSEKEPQEFLRFLADPENMATARRRLYVYHVNNTQIARITQPRQLLEMIRRSFRFWYPVDLRCSGKDLIPNHLTMMLYNHTAIWEDEAFWPRGMRANGHLLINDQKMSKSTGNFLTAAEALDKFGADAVRYALADAGDGLDDANFKVETATNAVTKLVALLTATKEIVSEEKGPILDRAPYTQGEIVEYDYTDTTGVIVADCVFDAFVNDIVLRAYEAFERCAFRDGLILTFTELPRTYNQYVRACEAAGTRPARYLVKKYIELHTKLVAVICPHIAEELHQNVLCGKESIFRSPLPSYEQLQEAAASTSRYLRISEYVDTVIARFRMRYSDSTKPRKDGSLAYPNGIIAGRVYVVSSMIDWQREITTFLAGLYTDDGFPKTVNAQVTEFIKTSLGFTGKEIQKAMKYAANIITLAKTQGPETFITRYPFSEKAILASYSFAICNSLGLKALDVYDVGEGPDPEASCSAASLGKPIIFFE